ncbi:E3 ubiquitin-protein ligase RBBP6 isoform X2 [Anabas testudineus]|uniref:E3 ubiquitin-protein ligase RBBP6 isoform X2 n=1 Tax=Anabas testudineus TaxID=64144 RepID=UPI000E463348|nr:E3 ubiquitin-protein ligase RBBP6 isoform X2 [Anabas testudineus]
MTHVHYKFSSKLSYDTVVFDGPHVTLRDLKRQIMGREKLRAADCDLQITNAQSKEEYTDDEGLIPKGSSVIVRRIPISGGKSSSSSKTNNIESSAVQFHHACGAIKAMEDQSSSRALPFFAKMTNLAEADVSEEDKIKVMLNQSTYDSMNYNKKFGSVLPANYTCYRCGNTGHHIRNCPTSGDKNFEAPLRIKKSTGIPRSFMVEVDDPNIKGAMLTNSGRYAIPAIDAEAYAIGKKEKPPFIPQEKLKSEPEEDPAPDELLCLICHDLLSDAVVIPCCGNSYCDDCIRTTLLDSEEHVCPTCGQSDVSPDTLIANKFLRQAVNNYRKEQGHTKSQKRSCGASESQNITTRPSPVPTLPPITGQSQPQKPHQPTYSQQINLDSVQQHPPTHAADTLPLSGVPPAAKDPTSACSTASTSILPEQSPLEMPKEAEEKTQDDSATAVAALSVLVSDKEPTAAPAQLIPVVNRTIVTEQPQTVSLNQQQSSSSLGTTPSPCVPPTCWDSSSSSSGHPTRAWTESQQLPPSSSSYSATTPPLFPSPLFLSAHQSHHGYPPGYQPTTSLWPVPSPQGAPIPSLCSSTSTSSIPSLIPDEWYRHQRKKKERSPHRGSTYRRSSSNSKSSKSKSSRPYSKSSSRSRSRSRSRSQGRSRHQSSHSRHRDLHTRSHLSSSYSYGYKRSHSPTPSSSSSPQVGYYSRSKSPSDHQKKRHHMRHQSKKSSSSSCNSRRRGERSERETGGSEAGLAPHLYAQHPNQAASLDLDRERYLQWKKEYKEWCDKYFSSYVGHFHQLPLPLLNLPPPPLPPPPPQWVDRGPSKKHSHAHSESVCQPQGKRTTQMDDHSPSSQSSSDSRSPPSQSSSGSHSTASQLFSDSSSPSCASNNSRSPPSQSSSDGRSTPSEDGTQSRAYQQKYSHLPIPLSKGLEEVKLRERSKNDKEVNVKNLEDFSTKRHDSRNVRRREEGRGEETSPAVAGSADNSRTDERMHGNGPNACKDGTSVQDEATTRDTLTSVQRPLIPKKSLDKHCEGESREQSNLKGENRWRRGQHSDVRHDVGRPHKVKPSKEADRLDTGRHRNPGDRKTADTRSENNRKRKGEEVERTKTQRNTESPNSFDGKKQKNEKKKEIKTQPLTERDIWEEGIKVKPQKKISININLDGKREKHDQELSFTQSFSGKTKEQTEKTGNEEEKLNKDHEAKLTAHKEFSREKEGMWEEIIKPGEVEANKMWEKNTFREVEIWDKFAAEEEDAGEKTKDREDEDFDLWHCALRGVVEEKESERMTEKGREERIGNESQGQEMTELVQNSQKERTDGKSTSNKNKEISLEESKSNREELPVEGVRRTIQREENQPRYEEQSSRHKSHHDGSTDMELGSRCKDHQRTVVQTLEYPRDTVREGERLLTKVPLSKLDKESDQVEQDKEELSARDALPVCVPPPLVFPKNQETKGENDQQTWRSVDIERDGDSQMQRGRFMERDATLPGINRAVAPSSGKHRTDSTMCTDGERERRMELEGGRHSERRRESEGKSERQKEKKKSKEKRREEERGRYWGSERSHSSTVSDQRRNHPSSGLVSSSSERSYYAPSRKHSSSERKEGSSKSRAVELPDKNAYTTHREESKSKDRNPHSHKDSSRNYHHQDRPAGTHHSPPSLSHTQGKDRDPLSFSLKPRMSSSSWELIQNRSRDESKEEKGEWKPNKLDKVIRDSKSNRETREVEDERDGGSRWEEEEEANKLAGGSKWEERRELEEGERSSSRSSNSSSSASLENTTDDRRQERKKNKKHRKEKRQAVSELQEETELQKHKKSKQSRESGGEEDDHTRPFSVTFS